MAPSKVSKVFQKKKYKIGKVRQPMPKPTPEHEKETTEIGVIIRNPDGTSTETKKIVNIDEVEKEVDKKVDNRILNKKPLNPKVKKAINAKPYTQKERF